MHKFVASIFFEELRVERPLYGGDFRLPAVPRGDPPALLLVRDHTQMEPQPVISGGRSVPRLILGEHIAHDVYEHMATMGLGMSVDCGPGVWVVRDSVPEKRPDGSLVIRADGKFETRLPTDQEKQVMFDEDLAFAISRQQRYGDYLISQGDAYMQTPKERILITKRMKAAAKYFSREREWLEDLKDGDLKLCPYCVKSIDVRAVKCPSCGEIVDPARHAAMLAQRKRLEKEAVSV
jgi:hypothetical protein